MISFHPLSLPVPSLSSISVYPSTLTISLSHPNLTKHNNFSSVSHCTLTISLLSLPITSLPLHPSPYPQKPLSSLPITSLSSYNSPFSAPSSLCYTALTDLQLSLYPSLAALTVVSLCAIVLSHHLHKFAAESGMLCLLYPEVCAGLAHMLLRFDVLFNDCKVRKWVRCSSG